MHLKSSGYTNEDISIPYVAPTVLLPPSLRYGRVGNALLTARTEQKRRKLLQTILLRSGSG